MKRITFSKNWNNKLGCNIFTTIRKHTDDKEEYYTTSEGETFAVISNACNYFEATLVKVETQIFPMSKTILKLDTGIEDYSEVLKVFKKFGIKANDKVLLLIFKRRT